MWRRVGLPVALAVTVLVQVAGAEAASRPRVSITVLSSRADLVSGGSALVRITPASAARGLRVRVGRRDVTRAFARRADGSFAGLVTGLKVGPSTLRATRRDGSGARIVLVNHPPGGPVFAGPQMQPWVCQPGAADAQCNQPPTYRYLYRSTDASRSGLQAYDPKQPPRDVARTRTDQGVTVPFVVRLETGYMDRDQYKVATLYNPDRPWTTFRPQPQFNHKLLITHGFGCGVEFKTASAPDVLSGAALTALGRGFITMSTALNNSSHNCNVAVQAESMLMAKEHIAKTYGTLRYTIGTGCSGGSLAQQWVANAYPGVYQGILPTCSFPDAWTSATQVADYALLQRYFLDLSMAGRGVVWSPTQWGAVEGNLLPVDALLSVGCFDPNPPYTPQTCPTGYFYGAIPTWPCAGPTPEQRYDPRTNPAGARCSIADVSRNLLGVRGPAVWSDAEKRIGRGFTGLPIDNVGVQYGLDALRQGQITPSQFVDLNAHIGGADIDVNPRPARLVADRPALANAYRTGLINETNNLDRTAIIDCRGPDPGAAHDSYRAFAVRARLEREHGTHANQLIWTGAAPLIGDVSCEVNSFLAMDRWLAAVERDHSDVPLAKKLVADRPDDLYDRCYDGIGQKLSDGLCPDVVVPVYGTPRMVAGDHITTDTNKCRLAPLDRGAYGAVRFSDAEWAVMRATFPDGVCDFSVPGVDQQDTVPWLTYQDARGRVITGGRPMGPAPRSVRLRARR